jgi:hypothetical protein
MKPRIAPLAGAGLLALASLNGWIVASALGMLHDEPAADQKVEWRPQLSTSGDVGVVQKPIEDYPLTVARPVFYKTREPFVPPPPPPPPSPPKVAQPALPAPVDPGLTLGGVMTTGHLRKAYLLTKANPAGSWVAEGDNFMRWTVRSVDNSSVKVQQQDRTIGLQLYPQGQTDGSPPPTSTESAKEGIMSAGPQAAKVGPPMLAPVVSIAK